MSRRHPGSAAHHRMRARRARFNDSLVNGNAGQAKCTPIRERQRGQRPVLWPRSQVRWMQRRGTDRDHVAAIAPQWRQRAKRATTRPHRDTGSPCAASGQTALGPRPTRMPPSRTRTPQRDRQRHPAVSRSRANDSTWSVPSGLHRWMLSVQRPGSGANAFPGGATSGLSDEKCRAIPAAHVSQRAETMVARGGAVCAAQPFPRACRESSASSDPRGSRSTRGPAGGARRSTRNTVQ